MTQSPTLTDNNNIETFRESWDLDPNQLDEETELYGLIDAMAQALESLDVQIEEAYKNNYVSSAQGYFLGKLGELVGVEPRSEDTNEELRKRIELAYAAKSSNGTIRDIGFAVSRVLETDSKNVEIIPPSPGTDGGAVEVVVSQSLIDDNPLTESELENGFEDTVSAGHIFILTGS